MFIEINESHRLSVHPHYLSVLRIRKCLNHDYDRMLTMWPSENGYCTFGETIRVCTETATGWLNCRSKMSTRMTRFRAACSIEDQGVKNSLVRQELPTYKPTSNCWPLEISVSTRTNDQYFEMRTYSESFHVWAVKSLEPETTNVLEWCKTARMSLLWPTSAQPNL